VAPGSAEIRSEYQPHTLGFTLKHCPQTELDEYAYDLSNRPALTKQTRDHLLAHIN